MHTQDKMIKGRFTDFNASFVLVETTNVAKDGILIHNTDPVASYYFCKALTATALISSMLTENQRYSVKWAYKGKLKGLIADVDSDCNLRGIPNVTSMMETVEEEAGVYGEEGVISIVKFDGGKVLSSSMSQAGLMEVSDDIAFFLSTSDQMETEMETLIQFQPDPENPVEIAMGFMLQAPYSSDLVEFEKLRASIKDPQFASILADVKDVENKIFEIVRYFQQKELLPATDCAKEAISYQEHSSPSYTCSCSKEKMLNALNSIGQDELKEIFEKEGHINIKCEFCSSQFHIDEKAFNQSLDKNDENEDI